MTPHVTDNPALAKIRKLLAKAEDDATTPAEAELYTEKAAQLIAAYGIDQALLAAELPRPASVTDRRITLEAPYARDKAGLLATVATSLRCQCVQMTKRGGGATEFAVHVFGQQADVERAELLFTSLLMQSATALRLTPVPRGESHAAFRRSWLAGFTAAIGQRLRAAERRAEADASARTTSSGTSAALVLLDQERAVTQTVRETYPHLRNARPRSLSGSGAHAGRRAGERADLGGSRLHTSTPPALR